jgi:hypothetical protein
MIGIGFEGGKDFVFFFKGQDAVHSNVMHGASMRLIENLFKST